MKIKTVKIAWSYPMLYENSLISERANETGVYYISRKFGHNETLIYIGKTNNSFSNRLNSHKEWLGLYRGKIFIRLGTIISPKNYSNDLLTDVESALIYEIKPIENTDKVKSYSYYSDCEIINVGYRGILPRVVYMQNHI